jgi:hypothetical protein
MCKYAEKDMATVAPHLSRNPNGIWRKSGSGSRRVGRGREEMTASQAVKNPTNWVYLRNLEKSD